jgi:CspA family cold shock protein
MSEETQSKLVGKVKWFNNKAGYGFITASEGEYSGKDIFVHYSTINVANLQYKYLVQGEYVEFELVKSQNDKHEYQATNVTGIRGGSIMCETRSTLRTNSVKPRPVRTYRKRPETDRPEGDNTDEGFVTVEKKLKKRVPKKQE